MKSRNIVIQNQITGEKEILYNICDYSESTKCAMLADRIEHYLENHIPIFIDFNYMKL